MIPSASPLNRKASGGCPGTSEPFFSGDAIALFHHADMVALVADDDAQDFSRLNPYAVGLAGARPGFRSEVGDHERRGLRDLAVTLEEFRPGEGIEIRVLHIGVFIEARER